MYINKIKNLSYGLFQGFRWPSDLDIFAKRSILFGWNGTGKTTLSKVFRVLETGVLLANEGSFPTFSFEIEGERDLTENNISKSPYIRVFNKDFIDDVVFRSEDQGGTPFIYYIGEKQASLEKELLSLEKNLGIINKEKNKLETETAQLDREKKNISSERALVIKNSVSTGGDHPFNIFDATHFNNEYTNIKARLNNDPKLNVKNLKLSDEQIKEKKSQIINSRYLESLAEELNVLEKNTNQSSLEGINKTLEKIVDDRKIIDRLENDKEIHLWVKEGFDLHKNKGVDKCAFCEQKLPHKHLENLSNYFSKEFNNLQDSINSILESINPINTDNTKDTDLLSHIVKLNQLINEFRENIENKKNKIGEKCIPNKALEQQLTTKLQETKAHLGDPKERIENIKSTLVTAYVADVFESHEKLSNNIKSNYDLIKEKEDNAKKNEKRITEIKTEIEDTQIPLKEINSNLNFILGHEELALVADKKTNGYKILRDGLREAKSLSEGEKTAIAVAYFVARIGEKDFKKDKGIVVFDDPISSLDANALYSIHALIVDAVRDIPQTIILTHNLEFFNLLKQTYKNKENRNLYSVCIENNESGKRLSKIANIDPCLEKFESDYQYLFKLLHDFEKKSDAEKEEIKNLYPYPNISRRFLEIYLNFKCPSTTDLRSALDSRTKVDSKKREKVYRFANTHSHGGASGLTGFASGVLVPGAKDAVALVLDIVRDDDIDHYKSLEKSIK